VARAVGVSVGTIVARGMTAAADRLRWPADVPGPDARAVGERDGLADRPEADAVAVAEAEATAVGDAWVGLGAGWVVVLPAPYI
jgi:hypothetical protein